MSEYAYRPFSSDPEEVRDVLEKCASIAVSGSGNYDIGTKKRPKGTEEERKAIASNARVVFEALGVLPDGFQPRPEDESTTRRKCGHTRCGGCDRCWCNRVRVQAGTCTECK